MNYETAEAWVLAGYGMAKGIGKEIRSEITTERLEVAALILCTATLAITGKMIVDGWRPDEAS